MKLTVGVSQPEPTWNLVLQQCGVCIEHIAATESLSSRDFAVLILTASTPSSQKEQLETYLNAGGIVITEADTARRFFGISTQTRRIGYLNPGVNNLIDLPRGCDLNFRTEVCSQATLLHDQSQRPALSIRDYGNGALITMPARLLQRLLSYRIKRKNFLHFSPKRYISERVNEVSKDGIRQIIAGCIRIAMHRRGLPFVHLWHLPDGWHSCFAFRVDTDFGTQQQIDRLYKVCKDMNISATWFVETKSARDRLTQYADMENQEIGYHCYRHRIFRTLEDNIADIAIGLKALRKVNLKPQAYAAPFGEWTPILNTALVQHGFNYSSEFGLSYDNLPFYPIVNGFPSPVLQVPVHPMSFGGLVSAEEMKIYYIDTMEFKTGLNEAVFFYHHPGHERFETLRAIFEAASRLGLPFYNLGNYADWWRIRLQSTWNPQLTSSGLVLNSEGADDSVYVYVEYPNKTPHLMPLNEAGSRTALPLFTPPTLPNLSRLRRYYWKNTVKDIEFRLNRRKF